MMISVGEAEKLHVKLDAVSVAVAHVSQMMISVGEAEPLSPIEEEGHKTREYIAKLAIVCFIMLFIEIQYLVFVHTPTPSPACAPITDCATVFPWKWDAMTTCARIFFTNEEY